VFADWYPGGSFPPNTLLVVARLVQPDFMVEIEAVAARAPGA
jgi:2-iminobutanoate/2-iminopropanoate deaminase